jgi:predicted phosphoribosyltransferase
MAPSLRVAEKIQPYFVVVLDGGPATAFGLRLAWPDFRSQRCPPVYVDTPLSHHSAATEYTTPAVAVAQAGPLSHNG